jgi:hypothetical protein
MRLRRVGWAWVLVRGALGTVGILAIRLTPAGLGGLGGVGTRIEAFVANGAVASVEFVCLPGLCAL